MDLHFDLILLIVLLGHCCQSSPLGGGVQVTQLKGKVKLGDPLEIICRAQQRDGLTVRLMWRWIANGATVNLNYNRLPPGAEMKVNVGVSVSIRWTKVPVEASGIYQCQDLNDVSQTSNTTLTVSSTNQHGVGRGENDYLIFQRGSTFNLTCPNSDAFGQVDWLTPYRVEEDNYYNRQQEKPLRLRLSAELVHDGLSESTSILTVQNASYLDTGYYICYNKNNINDIYHRQFVYVEDPENLILPPAMQPIGPNRDLRVIGHYSESNVQVGCGPTHPSVQVILKKIDDVEKTIASSDNPDDPNSDWSFNRFEGFKIKIVDSWDMRGQHQCKATWLKSSMISHSMKFKIKIQGVHALSNPSTSIFEGDSVNLTCRSKNKDAMDLAWRWLPAVSPPNQTINSFLEINANHLPADGEGMLPFENVTSPLEYAPSGTFQVHQLKWRNIPMNAKGIYQCYDSNNLKIPVSNITVNVSDPKAPDLIFADDVELDVDQGSEFSLECHDTVAVPKAKVQWYMKIGNKSAEEILDDGRTKYHDINTTDDGRNSSLIVYYASADTTYSCRFSNFKGTQEKYFHVMVHGLGAGIIAAIVIVFAIMIVGLILLGRFIKSSHKQKQVYQELISNRLKLLEGNLERMNPNSPLEDQLDLLPYDSKYEFPSNHLVLGKQLGAGQFGRVVQAKAVGMGPGNNKVAVKMVKSALDNTGLTSLASELKILIHLGFHLNVVSLLGACTKNLIKGELMVIVEFCAYGNVQDYLMNNRRHFMNELDANGESPCQQKAAPQLVSQLIQNIHNSNLNSSDECAAKGTTTEVANSSDNSSDYKSRYWLPNSSKKEETRSPIVCTHDLIEWSYQIACGMNYLNKRKVLHGDLAARNVLLAENNIVKIADFGLSRQVYKNCNYEKKGQEALPVKWMAIESLVDRVFSSQSDVWSYGVTIWELFSLSKQPYPEVNELADLIRFLQNGQRMEKPEFMPKTVGDIMADCWKHNTEERATFAQLEQIFGEMVDPIIRQRFAGAEVLDETNNYMQMSKDIASNSPEVSEPNCSYLRMDSAENREITSEPPQRPNFPPKLYPQLSVTNYINTSTEVNTPPQSPLVYKNIGEHPPLSHTESFSDTNYLAMSPPTQV